MMVKGFKGVGIFLFFNRLCYFLTNKLGDNF